MRKRSMKTAIGFSVMVCVAGCTVDPAHLACERRLVPINAVAQATREGKRADVLDGIGGPAALSNKATDMPVDPEE